jgi:hypothetical protein
MTIPEWASSLNDETLRFAESVLAEESARRHKREPEGPINTDEEIRRLRALWEKQEREAEKTYESARRERMKRHRDDLLAGRWNPPCRCDSCLHAVLEMNHGFLCSDQEYNDHWW